MIKNNFILRTLTGILFVALITGGILWNHISFLLLFIAISVLSVWEFARIMIKAGKCQAMHRTSATGAALLFLSFTMYSVTYMPVAFSVYTLFLLYVMIAELYRKSGKAIENIALFFMGQVYVALPFALLNMSVIGESTNGTFAYDGTIPLMIFIFLWLNDTGAYCIGTLFGKHRLFERISPKQSWEGFFGGAAFAIAGGYVSSLFIDSFNTAQLIGMSVTVVAAGTLGDLFESMLKREIGIKDSGEIIPGHGGMLDRFDSAMFAIPAVIIDLYSTNMF